jgi:hypothetical protein
MSQSEVRLAGTVVHPMPHDQRKPVSVPPCGPELTAAPSCSCGRQGTWSHEALPECHHAARLEAHRQRAREPPIATTAYCGTEAPSRKPAAEPLAWEQPTAIRQVLELRRHGDARRSARQRAGLYPVQAPQCDVDVSPFLHSSVMSKSARSRKSNVYWQRGVPHLEACGAQRRRHARRAATWPGGEQPAGGCGQDGPLSLWGGEAP